MSCCCENSLDLGCINPCLPLQISYVSAVADEYILELNSGVRIDTFAANIALGEPLIFDINGTNEDITYQGKVYLNGAHLVFVDADEIEYDCIKFTTQIGGVANQDSPALTKS